MRGIHQLNPGTGVENLIPDVNGRPDLLAEVFESRPEWHYERATAARSAR